MRTTRILTLIGAMGTCCSWGLLGCAVGGELDEDRDEMGEGLSPEEDVDEVELANIAVCTEKDCAPQTFADCTDANCAPSH